MGKVVIGIHGLQNKPPRKILDLWWRQSIKDGLWQIARPRLFFNFKLAYWAHISYPVQLDPDEKNPQSPFYITAPYCPYTKARHCTSTAYERLIHTVIMPKLENVIFNKTKYFNLDALGYYIVKKRFKDLHSYYHKRVFDGDWLERPIKELVRNELARLLEKHRKDKILLIAHSMGAIIAYDVLSSIVPEIPIHTLITIGSPLGNPLIKKEIIEEQKEIFHSNAALSVPPGITRAWFDIADPDDNISMHHDLDKTYKPNNHGVCVKPVPVTNDYEFDNEMNPHKVYGYLRTEACARIIDGFLSEGKKPFFEDFKRKLVKFFSQQRSGIR